MDRIEIEILPDGTIKADSGPVSPQNHSTAEAFMRNLAVAAGGEQTRRHKAGVLGAIKHAIDHALNRPHGH